MIDTVSGDITEETDLTRFFALSDPVVEPSALEEEASAIKTLQPQVTIDQTPTRATEPHLDSDRVTSPPEVAEKVAQAVTPAVFEEVSEEETALVYNLFRICELVNELLATYSKISENRQIQVEHLKREYESSSLNASNKIREGGNATLWIGIGSVVVGGGSLLPCLSDSMKELCKNLAPQISNFGSIWTTSIESKKHLHTSKEGLSLNELQTKANQTGQQDNSKVTQLLDAAISLQKAASSGG